jgi:pyruvate formate lyase activating enzyme
MDAANIDLKAFTEDFYHKLTYSHLQPVLDTPTRLRHDTDVWFEITTLIIPGHNDSLEEIDRECEWVLENLGAETPLHFSAFHPDFKMLDVPRTPVTTLVRAREQALEAGLKHVYTGNVHDEAGQSTYCAGCGVLLIERDWYRIGTYRVVGGACPDCGHALAGRFVDRKGTWGQRRLPIQIY